jgi:hypothetical protein
VLRRARISHSLRRAGQRLAAGSDPGDFRMIRGGQTPTGLDALQRLASSPSR